MTDRVRYQYDNLEGFARQFSDHAADAQQVRTRLSQQLAILEDGGWIGEGAKRFSAEMREQILPALDALARALDGANGAILRARRASTRRSRMTSFRRIRRQIRAVAARRKNFAAAESSATSRRSSCSRTE